MRYRQPMIGAMALLLFASMARERAFCTDTYFASVTQLKVDEGRYLGKKRLLVKGFLEYFPFKDGPNIVLYATQDDAIMRNYPAGVVIIFRNNEQILDETACIGKFVQVIAEFGKFKTEAGEEVVAFGNVESIGPPTVMLEEQLIAA